MDKSEEKNGGGSLKKRAKLDKQESNLSSMSDKKPVSQAKITELFKNNAGKYSLKINSSLTVLNNSENAAAGATPAVKDPPKEPTAVSVLGSSSESSLNSVNGHSIKRTAKKFD